CASGVTPVLHRPVFRRGVKQPVSGADYAATCRPRGGGSLWAGKENMNAGIFITGTDTGVGKTHVTAALLAELRRRGVRAAAFKPIACGAGGRRDAEIYAAIMDHEQPL